MRKFIYGVIAAALIAAAGLGLGASHAAAAGVQPGPGGGQPTGAEATGGY